MSNENINWEDIEQKIAIICNKFQNLSSWREDLEQELRIHAYYTSDNYYDLYRRAIDFWRKLQTKQFPETPYYDLEVLNPAVQETAYDDQYKRMVELIYREIERYGNNKWEETKLEATRIIMDFIVADIDEKINDKRLNSKEFLSTTRINLSMIEKETGINYKRLVGALKFLEDIVQGLAMMHKIDIGREYTKNYFED